jgi:hypothetical protein
MSSATAITLDVLRLCARFLSKTALDSGRDNIAQLIAVTDEFPRLSRKVWPKTHKPQDKSTGTTK